MVALDLDEAERAICCDAENRGLTKEESLDLIAEVRKASPRRARDYALEQAACVAADWVRVLPGGGLVSGEEIAKSIRALKTPQRTSEVLPKVDSVRPTREHVRDWLRANTALVLDGKLTDQIMRWLEAPRE